MISVSEAKALIAAHLVPLPPVTLGLADATAHVLAEDVYAPYDIPAFQQSSMDGYALKFYPSQHKLRLVGEMAAGTAQPLHLQAGEASRIFTGAPLPEGADTVVMQEKISLEEGYVLLHGISLQQGEHVRPQGSEIRAGELAMQAGSLLSPAATGFLAGIGREAVSIYPLPKVALIVTGKELQQPGKTLAFGQVYESNSYSLRAALQQEGLREISIFQADDLLEVLAATLQDALAEHDVVILTGGVSVGDYDFVVEAARRCGVHQVFHRVKQKPGKPLFFGTKGKQLIFGLPGNPSSVLNCYYNYVLPAIRQLSHRENSVKTIPAVLVHEVKKAAGLTHFLKGSYCHGEVSVLHAQESFRLRSFAQANCLICLDENQENFQAGDTVKILLLP